MLNATFDAGKNDSDNHYTKWLYQTPSDVRLLMAIIYVETMSDDVQSLDKLPTDLNDSLAVIHRIKGGAGQIGLRCIEQLAIETETLGKAHSSSYVSSLVRLIHAIKESIKTVEAWIDNEQAALVAVA